MRQQLLPELLRRLLRELAGLRFQPLDDRVDLATAFAQLIVELGIESTTVGVFALADRFFARAEGALGIDERDSFLCQRPAFRFDAASVRS